MITNIVISVIIYCLNVIFVLWFLPHLLLTYIYRNHFIHFKIKT